VRLDDGARAGAVDGVVEENPLAHRLASTEGGQAHRAGVLLLLDGDGAGDDEGEELSRLSLAEEELVTGEIHRLDELRELVDGGIGEPVQEMEGPELLAEGLGHRRERYRAVGGLTTGRWRRETPPAYRAVGVERLPYRAAAAALRAAPLCLMGRAASPPLPELTTAVAVCSPRKGRAAPRPVSHRPERSDGPSAR
jgi:hypothetical protein